jgi:hypothetical protein
MSAADFKDDVTAAMSAVFDRIPTTSDEADALSVLAYLRPFLAAGSATRPIPLADAPAAFPA